MREDTARLRALLSSRAVKEELADVGQVAYQSSAGFLGTQRYEALTKAFCDGIQIRVGSSFNRKRPWLIKDLEQELNADCELLIIRHIMVTGSQDSTSLWITLMPETAELGRRTVAQIHEAVKTVRRCAGAMWGFADQAVEQIEVTKVDVTMDYKGSFLPRDHRGAYHEIKAVLERELGKIFSAPGSNFLAPVPLTGLKLRRGDNNLASCVQYAVLDGDGLKLLQVKIYDKIMDLVGRDGAAVVGSRIAKIVGCQGTLNAFDKRVSQARWVGMTRLEISLCHGALRRYNPFQPSMKTLWAQRVNAAFEHLDRLVLNDRQVLTMSHRRLNIAHLLGELSLSQVQVLAVGHQASWLVSHRTAHRNHFVGTQLRHKDGCSGKFKMKASRIATFAKRFAAADSQIRVYSLMADGPGE